MRRLRGKRAGGQKKSKLVSHAPILREGWLTGRQRGWLAAVKLYG
jgi:hypothetical protein